jgi:flagellar biosynthesis/type III secretory pathway chaperone
MTESYLSVLEDSLQKKLQVMKKIREYNLRQQEIFTTGKPELDKFDEYVEEKGSLIEELSALDRGFETLYEKVAGELADNRERYTAQIKKLQELVTKVTEESVTIQAQEARNKKLIEDYFSRERTVLGKNRKAASDAYNYYRKLSQADVVPPQFLDKKK